MDILTQGLLGAVLAQAVADKEEKKPAALVGAAAGLLADADVLIRSSSDPLLTIEYHRHFSHSLLFVPVGAAIAMLLLWPFMRRHLSLRRLYVFCLAGYSLSGVLDACTSYGTQLFWPFSDERVALNIISIVDPVFTLALFIALLLGLWLKQRALAVTGLLFCVAYMGLGKLQLERARDLAQDLIARRDHIAEQHVVKPTIANLLLWRSVYVHDRRIYVDAVRVGLFGSERIYAGESIPVFAVETDLPGLDPGSTQYRDIGRFIRFSNGFVGLDPAQANVIGDIRYSMLPVSVKPLWGIVIDPAHPDAHTDYRFFRSNSKQTRKTFINLVLGRD